MSEIGEGYTAETPISQVKVIARSGEMIKTRGEIRDYVEPPLVEACEHLWDLNIQTIASSANAKDVGGDAYIVIDYSTLSGENKEIAEEQGELLDQDYYRDNPAVKIKIPVSEKTTLGEVRAKANAIAELFKKQRAIWIPSYTIQELRKLYGLNPNDEKYGLDDFKSLGLYFDEKGARFYLSQEHFQKATEEVETPAST